MTPSLPAAPPAPHAPTLLERLPVAEVLPAAVLVAIAAAGGFADHHVKGAAAAIGGIVAVTAFDAAVADWYTRRLMAANAGKTPEQRTNDFTPAARASAKLRGELFVGAVPVALFAAGLLLQRYHPEAGKLVAIAGGGAAAATLYVLLDGPLPSLMSK